ncbi:MAG: VCBS repeat-containing protein [Gammaproteobacteria bacterium]
MSLLLTLGTGVAAAGTPQAISGDFNGDGQLDALMQPVDDTGQTSIILSDSTGQLTIPGQTWPAGYLGLNWGQTNSNIHVGDLTGNGRDDILVQSLTTGGPSGVLFSDPNGQFPVLNQSIPTPYLGMDWSTAGHQIVTGKFAGGLQSEVLLQTANPGGQNMIVQPNAQGMLVTTAQTWADGYLGLHWDAQDVTLYTGDFTGDGQDGLLMQVQSTATEANPAPYTLLLPDAQGQFTQVSQTWGLNAFGADWSPATHTLIVEDVNGDGIADIVLQSKTGGTNYHLHRRLVQE